MAQPQQGSTSDRQLLQRFLKNPPLHRVHFLRFDSVAIIETVQMQQTMYDAQAKFLCKRISKPMSMTTSRFRADENFAVLKGKHIRRAGFAEKLSMQRRHAAIGYQQNENPALLG